MSNFYSQFSDDRKMFFLCVARGYIHTVLYKAKADIYSVNMPCHSVFQLVEVMVGCLLLYDVLQREQEILVA